MPNQLLHLLWSGWTTLLDYLAAHVLLCLLPAFLISGYISALLPKEVVVRYLGPRAPRWVSYPAAALGGFLLAVCSCTILPLFGGIWKRGAGLGPAVTFLFVGPAVNVLAIAYTASALGLDLALARILLSIFFGIAIGLLMAWFFRREEAQRTEAAAQAHLFELDTKVKPGVWAGLAILASLLVAGTLQVPWLTEPWPRFSLLLPLPAGWTPLLTGLQLNAQGALLIALLVALALSAYFAFRALAETLTPGVYVSLGLGALTILLAAPSFDPLTTELALNGRFVLMAVLLAALVWVSRRTFAPAERAAWLWETWKFVRQIFPLLIAGVFTAGVLKALLPSAWIQSLAGQNTLTANLAGVAFGVLMYFPTLVEVPVARMFLDLGMQRGPLLAYLLADPELSLQSILVTSRLMGRQKTAAYVSLVALFSTLAGWLFGSIAAR